MSVYLASNYNTLESAGTIIPGDYLYDYPNGSLFVTSFTPFQGWLLNVGTGYGFPGHFFMLFKNAPLIGGTGSGATVDGFALFGSINSISAISNRGSGYTKGDICDIDIANSISIITSAAFTPVPAAGTGAQFLIGGITSTGGVADGGRGLFDLTVY